MTAILIDTLSVFGIASEYNTALFPGLSSTDRKNRDPWNEIDCIVLSHAVAFFFVTPPGGLLPYMAYTGMCRWTGYGFWPLRPKQGM